MKKRLEPFYIVWGEVRRGPNILPLRCEGNRTSFAAFVYTTVNSTNLSYFCKSGCFSIGWPWVTPRAPVIFDGQMWVLYNVYNSIFLHISIFYLNCKADVLTVSSKDWNRRQNRENNKRSMESIWLKTANLSRRTVRTWSLCYANLILKFNLTALCKEKKCLLWLKVVFFWIIHV